MSATACSKWLRFFASSLRREPNAAIFASSWAVKIQLRRVGIGSASFLGMPIRERIWAGLLVSCALLGATACNDDKEQAAKLAEVQRIADEKLKKAEQAANEKVAALQKQL